MPIGFQIDNEEQEEPLEVGHADSQELPDDPDTWDKVQAIVYNVIDLVKQVTQLFNDDDKAAGE